MSNWKNKKYKNCEQEKYINMKYSSISALNKNKITNSSLHTYILHIAQALYIY